MKDILNSPSIYQLFQFCGGFFSARVKAINQYLELRPGQNLIDIGCGPGHILPKLPRGVFYDGFDTDEKYIRYANRHFGHLGKFHCRVFDATAAKEFGPADGVMMNGVLHHLDDKTFIETTTAIRSVLRPVAFYLRLMASMSRGRVLSPSGFWIMIGENSCGTNRDTAICCRTYLTRPNFVSVVI